MTRSDIFTQRSEISLNTGKRDRPQATRRVESSQGFGKYRTQKC